MQVSQTRLARMSLCVGICVILTGYNRGTHPVKTRYS